MDYVICDISAYQFWSTPPDVGAIDLAAYHEVALIELPAWLRASRSNAREADRLVQQGLATRLKGLTLPVHVMVADDDSRHVSALVAPHRTPPWLRGEHVVSLGNGLSVLTPELSLLLRQGSASRWAIALDMFSACGIYAVHRPTELSAMALKLLRDRGDISPRVDPGLIVFGYSDASGRPLGNVNRYGGEYPWTPCFDRHGIQTDLWKRYPLTSVEALQATASQLAGVRGAAQARAVLATVRNGAASPLEARACLMLCAGRSFGGEAFGDPDLNRQIDFDGNAQVIAHQQQCFGDLVWADRKRVLEVQGAGVHANAEGFYVQTGRAPALKAMGYLMREITHEQLANLELFDAVLPGLADDLGFELVRRTPKFLARRNDLHQGLFGR